MAAPSRQEVETMIADALLAFEQRVGQHMQQQAAVQVTVEQARAGVEKVVNDTKAEFVAKEKRITDLITMNNATFAEHKTAMEKIVNDLQLAGVDGTRLNLISSNLDTALDGTKALSEGNEKMRVDLEKLAIELKSQVDSVKVDATKHIEVVRDEASKWAETFKTNLYSIMEAGNSFGKGGGKGSGGKD